MKLSREVKTGILAIGALLLFIFGYSFLKGSNLFDSSRTFYVKYDNVAGLSSSAPVTVNGLQIGKVKGIELSKNRDGLVVKFSVDNDFEFSRNSVVQIYSSGFISGNNLGILPEYDANNVAKNGDTLQGEIQKGMIDGIMDKFGPIETSLKTTLAKLDTVLGDVDEVMDDKTKENLRKSIASFNETMVAFKGISRNMNALVSENKDKMNSTFANLDVTSANFAKLSDSLSQIEMGKMVKDLENAIGSFNGVMKGIDEGEGSIGKLLKDEKLYDNLTGASAQLEALLEDMKLNPKRYVHFSLFGKRAKQYESPQDTTKQ